MATIAFGAMLREHTRLVSLVAAADLSDVIPLNGPCNILCFAGTTFTLEVYRGMLSTGADGVLVGTQTETDRSGYYEFTGRGYVYVKLTALSAGGPVDVRVVAQG